MNSQVSFSYHASMPTALVFGGEHRTSHSVYIQFKLLPGNAELKMLPSLSHSSFYFYVANSEAGERATAEDHVQTPTS